MAKTVHCKYCEAANSASAKFCGNCGRELELKPPAPPAKAKADGSALVTCPYCAYENPAEAAFCARCGRSLAAQAPQPSPVVSAPTRPATRRRSRRGVWFGCLLALLLLVGAAAAVVYLIPSSLPEPIAGLIFGEPTATSTPPEEDEEAEAEEPTEETSVATDPPPTGAGSEIGELPTVTPFPTGTLRPTPTAMPTLTAAPFATLPFPTLSPATPTMEPDPFVLVGPSSVNVINQPWEQDGISLTARSIDIRSAADRDDAAARVWFRLVNKTGERILIEIDWNSIHLEDSFGTSYVDYYGGGTTSQWIEPGANYDFDRYYTTIIEQASRVPPEAAFVQIVVDSFSRVQNARWQFDINPRLSAIAPPDEGAAKFLGVAWEKDGVTLQLTNLDIADDHGGDAAARAWFTLTNSSNQEVLVDIDFGRIYLLDSFGRRFGDWDGGGLSTQTIAPGRSIDFNRYYSEMSGQHSRITRGATFVTLVVDKTAGQDTVLWLVNIDSRLSGVAGAPATPLTINQAWEQDGLSLTARTIDIRGQDSSEDAAARVWYRLVNKAGQRLLITVDWSTIHLEDSLGTVYGDYYGKQTTSFWIEPGGVYDFDRYYSTIVEQESRIPSTAESVTIVVETFSRVKNARWQRVLAPELVALAAPEEDATLAIGDSWEQDGVLLRLTGLEVRTESDRDDAAFRAWYEVVNTTNQTVLVEIDYGHLSLIDAFGGRFNDWDGGGLQTRWLEPGGTLEFNRYYSDMAGQPSRIARGSEFVLVWFGNVAGIPTGMWQLDIAR